jgi:hypothetical protein
MASLWAFAAFVTLRDGLNLLGVDSLTQNVGRPTESLVAALQQERRESVVYLAPTGDRVERRRALVAARGQTDRDRATFERKTSDGAVRRAATAALQARIGEARRLLDRLDGQRRAIDADMASPTAAADGYSELIDAGFRIYGSISVLDDPEIAKESRTLVALSRAREVLSKEDTLLAGALAQGRFTGTEHIRFAQLVGIRRIAYADAAAELPDAERAAYDKLVDDTALSTLRAVEDRVIDAARAGATPAVESATWSTVVADAAGELRAFELRSAQATLNRAIPAAVAVIIRLILAGGLGLLAVIASVIVSITTARSIVGQLVRLRDAARELADERLPAVVEQLRRGDAVDVDEQAPPLEFGNDEIGQVGQAFNAVQRTAVRAAVEQADLRRSIRDVYLSLARRTQALVHRQLSLLDRMERQETDADELAMLFRLDHLATRMRRNAENLIVLSGSASGRRWRQSIPMVDVIRGAVAEVEDYTRVQVLPMARVGLTGRAVGDVIHLLAELIENAASFSPPQTVIQIRGQVVGNGFAVEVEDRGLGMDEAAFIDANNQVSNPPDFHLSRTARLGLFVVGRLAQRQNVRVQLRGSPYGGTTAIVLIPSALMVEDLDRDAEAGPAPALVDARADNRRPDGGQAVADTGPDTAMASEPGLSTALVEPDPGPRQKLPPPPDHRPPILAEPAAVTGPPIATEPATVTGSSGGDPVAATVFGLPRRQRQAARTKPVSAGRAAATSARPAKARPPEAAWALMSAYQTGTRQGRAAAGPPASIQARETAPPAGTVTPDPPPEPGPAGPSTSDLPTG